MDNQQPRYIALDAAASALGVHRTMMYRYMKLFSIEAKRFPLDRRRYIPYTDFEKIKAAREAAAIRASQEEFTT